MSAETSVKSNPGPLGLLGFGMTTILLNLHNAEIISLSLVIVAMGIAMGGSAQIIAGVLEFKNGNTFGGTAFTAYGFFWWSLVLIWMNPFKAIAASDGFSMGFYLLLWGIFTFFMFIGTLKHNRATQVVFGSLTLLFFLLSSGDFTGVHAIHLTAGYVGIFCGASAVYSAVSQVLGADFGRLFKVQPAKTAPPPARAVQTRTAQNPARVAPERVTPVQAVSAPPPASAVTPDPTFQKKQFMDLPPSQDLVSTDVFAENEFPENEFLEDEILENEFLEDEILEDEILEDELPEDGMAVVSERPPLVPKPREEIPKVLEVKMNGAVIRVPNGADLSVLAQTLRLIRNLR